MAEILSLHIYPVKSCAGLDLSEMKIGPRGPVWDRHWLIVDEHGKFLTQRQLARMALIRPKLSEQGLQLSAEHQNDFLISFDRPNGKPVSVEVWKDRCEAFDEGDSVGRWLSDFLDTPVRLVRQTPGSKRLLPESDHRPGTHTSFADSLPFLLTTQSSLEDLNSRLSSPVPMNRFRPNIVISGSEPYAEDKWKLIEINGIQFDVARFTSRCLIVTIDQNTAEKNQEPLKTLATYRRDGTKVNFGQNLIHLHEGQLQIGQTVKIIAQK